MDPRLLRLYDRELSILRGMGGEFAAQFPKVAGRLGMERLECADPYVERLLEGFAFLAARVQLKIESEFPKFSQHLLENVYPHYLAPTPSMAIVQFEPDPAEGQLGSGFEIERGTSLRSHLGRGEDTACEYRTAHPVSLWPVEIESAHYQKGGPGWLGQHAEWSGTKATLRLGLRCTGGLSFDQIEMAELPVYLQGEGEAPGRLYEQLLGRSLGGVAAPVGPTPSWLEPIARTSFRPIGFGDAEALLPYGRRSFQGYRLLEEYFSFPRRFLFVGLGGLQRAVRRCADNRLEILILFDQFDAMLEGSLEAENFALFCTPVINLFEKRSDRINLSDRFHEIHVVADRTRPRDFEIHTVSKVEGFGSGQREQEFLPFYRARDRSAGKEAEAYYTVRREPRLISARDQRRGTRSSYIGSETYVNLVEAMEAPYSEDLRELSVTALCTNRDLPMRMTLGQGVTDFRLESGAPVESVRCIAGPTKPSPSRAEGEVAWRLINHLTLNHTSLMDDFEGEGASALRSLLMLYGDPTEPDVAKRIEGFSSVRSRPVLRRPRNAGSVPFLRGLEVELMCEESAFEGLGVFLGGAVLAQFFAQYVSINSFTETVVNSSTRGEVMRWPATIGRRLTL